VKIELYDKKIVIEFDGRQHFQPILEWEGEEGLKKIQENDKIKNEFCKKNNIIMFRISYLEQNNIKQLLYDFFQEVSE
jgi:hypothetical protein